MPRITEKLRRDRREAIVQAAVDCLALHGYHGTSMRTIAEAVGLTKGGLYPYFTNKDAILLAVSDRYLQDVVARLQPREGVGPALQIAEYLDDFEAAFRDARTDSARRAVLDLWLSGGDNPAVRRSIEKRFKAVGEALAAVVRRGQEEGFKVPVVVRLEGTNVERAREILKAAKHELPTLIPATHLTDAAKKVVSAVAA